MTLLCKIQLAGILIWLLSQLAIALIDFESIKRWAAGTILTVWMVSAITSFTAAMLCIWGIPR